ncbi:MAG: ubiquinone biosynthesis regulatory protein kinase UbiB [Gammaproteobacteria bacterium]|nr:ubiquinone biosynthesis regulatory protein kinase UbiB [Gammaproteobacteria bacterium]MDH5800277.1 ubiquinone biosynthesis regulatory protein kinase UbiB [Gammaproteobacteria bacterium]
MGAPAQFFRLISINRVLVRHGLGEIILATHLFRPLRFIFLLSPWRLMRNKSIGRGERIRRTLEDLGPIFVKFGQILSTRMDLLPEDIAVELAKLQDRVPSFPGAQARAIVEQAYSQPIDELFLEFNEQPLASASIAQVHAARLLNGKEVVVKVVRPDIEPTIRRDLALLYTLAELAQTYWSDGRRLRPVEVVREYEKTILDELDLMREAASASQLRRNFLNSNILYVPEIHWPLARKNVIVMERISGTPISDIDALREQGVDLKQLAEDGVEIFFTQVFQDNFFHADMHPGNIFVSPQGMYLAVDFGIMGTLGPQDQRYLAENFLAFFHRDYRKVAQLHVESGWVPGNTRVDEFESAIRTVCEPIFERPLSEISFGHLLLRLFQTARRFNMEVQPQLVLLQKTLLNIEGLGRRLYPQLDLWQTAKPFLEKWMSEQIGLRSLVSGVKDNASFWTEKLPELPTLMYKTLHNLQSPRDNSQAEIHMARLLREVRRSNRRIVKVIVGASLILGAIVLLQSSQTYTPVTWANAPVLTWMLGGLGALILIFAWPGDRR